MAGGKHLCTWARRGGPAGLPTAGPELQENLGGEWGHGGERNLARRGEGRGGETGVGAASPAETTASQAREPMPLRIKSKVCVLL